MIRIVTFLASLMLSFAAANAQSSYNGDMRKGIQLFEQGHHEQAAAVFEKIAENSQDDWLPGYYVALTNSLGSFGLSSDKEKMSSMLEKAQDFLDRELEKRPENVELLVVQTFIDTGWIIYSPMQYGMRASQKVWEMFNTTRRIDPTNPRLNLAQVQFNMHSSRYMGGNPMEYCGDVQKVIELFSTFKPETEFHPNWGLESAKVLAQQCENQRN